MSISKGKLFVGFEELERLFGLPEGVEILSVEQGLDGFDFKLASSEDVNVGDVKVTYKQERGYNAYRRLSLQRLTSANNKEIKDMFLPDIDEVIKEAIKEHRENKNSGEGIMFHPKISYWGGKANESNTYDMGKGIDMSNTDIMGVGGFSEEGKMIPFFDGHETILNKKDTEVLLDAQNLLKTIDSISFKDLPKLKIPKVDELFPVEVKVEIEKSRDIFQQALDNIKKQGK